MVSAVNTSISTDSCLNRAPMNLRWCKKKLNGRHRQTQTKGDFFARGIEKQVICNRCNKAFDI